MRMEETTSIFSSLRPRLQGIAYRMLGSVAESEDVVQDIWISWNAADHGSIESHEAWLVAVTTRRAIDLLRAAKVRRENYVGIWIPEPILTDEGASPVDLVELADDISVAFLLLLERLTPEARAAFLLREVFDVSYAEIATIIGKSSTACRQLVHRAKNQLRNSLTPLKKPCDAHLQLVRRFANALSSGDFPGIRLLLAGDVELSGDGGGKVVTVAKPFRGSQRVAQLLYAAFLRYGSEIEIKLARINGEWAILRYIEGKLESVHTYVIYGGAITSIHLQRNPDKLERVARGLQGFDGTLWH